MPALPTDVELANFIGRRYAEIERAKRTVKFHPDSHSAHILHILGHAGFDIIAASGARPSWWLLGYEHGLRQEPLEEQIRYRRTIGAVCEILGAPFERERTRPAVAPDSVVCVENLLRGQRWYGSEYQDPLWKHFVHELKNWHYEGRQHADLIEAMVQSAHRRPPHEPEQIQLALRMLREWFIPHIEDVGDQHQGTKFYLLGMAHVLPLARWMEAKDIPYVGLVQGR